MMDDGSLPRLSPARLMAVDRALDELARTQRRSSIPIELPIPGFWDAVGQLVQHLEAELAETIRSEGMTAKAQLQSRKLGLLGLLSRTWREIGSMHSLSMLYW